MMMNVSGAYRRHGMAIALCALLLVAGTACNESADDTHAAADTMAAGSGAAHTDTAAAAGDSAKPQTPAPAAAELAADTIPLRTPNGDLARYGIESGRIVQKYYGDQQGTRKIMFDSYGMLERREDMVAPRKGGRKGLLHNVITITTPQEQSYVDARSGKGQTRPNEALQRYIDMGAGRTKSLGEIVMADPDAERLPDTTIAGYHCRVLRKNVKGMTVTKWIWRGIALQEHFYIPADTLEYSIVPVEITPNVALQDTLFRFSSSYKLTPYKPKKNE